MLNAHLRMAILEYINNSEKTSTRFRCYCDHFAASKENGLFMVSLFGNDTETKGMVAAFSLGNRVTAIMPDGSKFPLYGADKITIYNSTIRMKDRPRPVQHKIVLSNTLLTNGSEGTVFSLNRSPDFAWAQLVTAYGLPALPEWGNHMLPLLEQMKKIEELEGFNCEPVLIRATREELVELIGQEVKKQKLILPPKNGPIFWPSFELASLLKAAA